MTLRFDVKNDTFIWRKNDWKFNQNNNGVFYVIFNVKFEVS